MHAVIKTNGKQYRVAKGDTFAIARQDGEVGDTIDLETIMIGDKLGSGTCKAEIVAHDRAEKIIVFKKKRRQGYKRKAGHQQEQTVIKITDVK